MAEIVIDEYTVLTLENIFKAMAGRPFEEIFDASVHLYNHVVREHIYPKHIVDGFYNAMAIIGNLTFGQFLQIKQAVNCM